MASLNGDATVSIVQDKVYEEKVLGITFIQG
jgi:hypothetical protein